MNPKERIACLVKTGEIITNDLALRENAKQQAKLYNPWFTAKYVDQALDTLVHYYLSEEALTDWMANYEMSEHSSKTVGLILAGNIPLVGVHDIISSFVSGHYTIIKPSSKDRVLVDYFLSCMKSANAKIGDRIQVVDQLKNYDAIIATGSDNASGYFEKYFAHVPHIIRKHRSAVAVVTMEDTADDIDLIGRDVFDYFGLGCRNVAKVYLEDGVDVDLLFGVLYQHKEVIHHHKYKNNFDYSSALYLMNNEDILTNDFIILRKDKSLDSRIACLHYEFYSDQDYLIKDLQNRRETIQCVISAKPIGDWPHVSFGAAQCPKLDDYADGVDTLAFLQKI